MSVLLGLVRTRFGSRPWVDDLSPRVGALAGLPPRTLLVLALRSVHGSVSVVRCPLITTTTIASCGC